MSLASKLLKNSKLKSAILTESKFFGDGEITPTHVLGLNIALSGDVEGGLEGGLIQLAAPSRHFKTSFALVMVAAYMKQFPDAMCLFYDSEFGAPQGYFESYGVDLERVIHTPIKNIEELKFDLVAQLEGIEKKDHVIIMIDSVGNLASKKEVEDAKDEKSVTDMTRAKALKGLWRIVTPYLSMNDIPLIAINHTYQTQEMYSKTVMSGGTGGMYSADTVLIIGREQDKEKGGDLEGFTFNVIVEKSRRVKEKSKVPIQVSFEAGINKWSGLFDIALDMGYIEKPKVGWYTRKCVDGDSSHRRGEFENGAESDELWKPIMEGTDFKEAIRRRYQLGAIGGAVEKTEKKTAYTEFVKGIEDDEDD